MSFYIYGFRVGGDPECRYVGMTSRQPEDRLNSFMSDARRVLRYGYGVDPEGFRSWLLDNEHSIEAFKFAKVETRAEALIAERAFVAFVLRLNHRLFNHWLVPADKRIGVNSAERRRRMAAA